MANTKQVMPPGLQLRAYPGPFETSSIAEGAKAQVRELIGMTDRNSRVIEGRDDYTSGENVLKELGKSSLFLVGYHDQGSFLSATSSVEAPHGTVAAVAALEITRDVDLRRRLLERRIQRRPTLGRLALFRIDTGFRGHGIAGAMIRLVASTADNYHVETPPELNVAADDPDTQELLYYYGFRSIGDNRWGVQNWTQLIEKTNGRLDEKYPQASAADR